MNESTFIKDSKVVRSLAAQGKYEEALDFLIKRLRSARGINDQEAVDQYAGVARAILTLVESEFGATRIKPKNPLEQYCGFCGRGNESKLIAGAKAFICKDCSDLIHGIFHDPEND